jgi:hypothetical protein
MTYGKICSTFSLASSPINGSSAKWMSHTSGIRMLKSVPLAVSHRRSREVTVVLVMPDPDKMCDSSGNDDTTTTHKDWASSKT